MCVSGLLASALCDIIEQGCLSPILQGWNPVLPTLSAGTPLSLARAIFICLLGQNICPGFDPWGLGVDIQDNSLSDNMLLKSSWMFRVWPLLVHCSPQTLTHWKNIQTPGRNPLYSESKPEACCFAVTPCTNTLLLICASEWKCSFSL